TSSCSRYLPWKLLWVLLPARLMIASGAPWSVAQPGSADTSMASSKVFTSGFRTACSIADGGQVGGAFGLAPGQPGARHGNGLALVQPNVDAVEPDALAVDLDLHQFEVFVPLQRRQRRGGQFGARLLAQEPTGFVQQGDRIADVLHHGQFGSVADTAEQQAEEHDEGFMHGGLLSRKLLAPDVAWRLVGLLPGQQQAD